MGAKDSRGIVSTERIARLLKKQNNKCFWCEEHINKLDRSSFSIDHVIPMAVYEWTKDLYDYSDNKDFLSQLRSDSNIVISCYDCNQGKSSRTVSPSVVKEREDRIKMKVPGYSSVYNNNIDRIDTYNYIIKDTCKKQNYKCIICGKLLCEDSLYLRRKLEYNDIVVKDTCALCPKCNNIIRYKIRNKIREEGL